jgi:hypothetical protein
LASAVTWELLMNAIFDVNGEAAIGAHLPVNIFLGEAEEVALAYGVDESAMVLSVVDAFGSLTREATVAALARAMRDGGAGMSLTAEDGAALGLYMILTNAHQIFFKVAPERSTEVTARLFLTKRVLEFKRRFKSLHFFLDLEVR